MRNRHSSRNIKIGIKKINLVAWFLLSLSIVIIPEPFYLISLLLITVLVIVTDTCVSVDLIITRLNVLVCTIMNMAAAALVGVAPPLICSAFLSGWLLGFVWYVFSCMALVCGIFVFPVFLIHPEWERYCRLRIGIISPPINGFSRAMLYPSEY